jgi:hypothetical protein
MDWMMRVMVVAVLVACVATIPALAHRPLAIYGTAPGPQEALIVQDPDVSQVAYVELSAVNPRFWLAVDIVTPGRLDLSIGVPVIDRLAGFRPAIAVVGPGLPEADPGFPVPAGLGTQILKTDEVSHPERFHEPFTGTDSWILDDWSVDLPQAGRYYTVTYDPSAGAGKVWVALGEREAFTGPDILALPATIRAVRRFHEVAGNPTWLNALVYGAVAIAAVTLWWVTARLP